ncbi:ABC transporter substrate-binding protein [Conexibacter sp. JD483]|uniref:ABC transporter substrate-binding protein n=1 Tax=unclassified Conexibacter TaxID=2627773 RepID=UPI0027248D60|nr:MULTISPECIES: ABC transporter substrate-binding protein [unclassified Conexibacter]MDO8185312.1 ABC transporter substrate-binding protein [Conexibacter sp. CPCC 205706]MDO8198358.1 ABC transporter substrate-binding protein [Conexibacter sp. CPCC 205762]MDR9370545.1 ABC transporter substrate-binding protein [Conexibacter sp. JD483]
MHSRLPRLLALLVALLLAPLLLTACGSSDDDGSGTTAAAGSTTAADAPPQEAEVTVALDWTPNTNHTGVYVAEAQGFYARQGIKLKLIPYASTAPEQLVGAGKADVGFGYQAGIAYARAAGSDVVGIFAPFVRGAYAITVAADRDDIASPRDLDGKTYAGFGTPDEGPELRYVIQQDGGRGDFKSVALSTAAYDAVYARRADFTISVLTWEGVQARLVDKPFKSFDLEQYGFPRQYSTELVASGRWLAANGDVARRFLAATQEGYAYAAAHPDEAASILLAANRQALKDPALVEQSQQLLTDGGYFADDTTQIGVQDGEVWRRYGEFLYSNGLLADGDGKKLTAEPDWSAYFTNDYLPGGAQ